MREMKRWLARHRDERAIIERIYSALTNLDVEAQSTKELIAGVHALRFQVRGAYYALYGEHARELHWDQHGGMEP